MANQKSSTFSQILLWFGAAISIAEIITGALLAPLGMSGGLLAILLGHLIGAAILLPAGLIGAKSGLTAASSVQLSFGKYGVYGFSALNILQLLGWTAIMILNGAKALDGVVGALWGWHNQPLFCAVIGLLICVWVAIGMKNLSKLNVAVMLALLACTIVLGFTVFAGSNAPIAQTQSISFGGAVELNVAMSLSWLPLIADYTCKLKKPLAGTIGSVAAYFVGSVLMFVIGLGAAIYAGTSDVTVILLSAGLGLLALVVVVLSTVTTTFLDVYSAGVCANALHPKLREKPAALVTCLIGTLLAIVVPMSQYENFLYLIGSVFAPLFAILFVDYFANRTLTRKDLILNGILWLIGFGAYRLLLPYNSVVGITLPVMAGIIAVKYALCLIKQGVVENGRSRS